MKFKQKLTAYLHGRSFPSTLVTAIITLSVVLLNIIIYNIGLNYPLYYQHKEELDLSVSGASDASFNEAISKGEKVTVTFCMYEDVIANHGTGKYVLETAKSFAEKYPELIKLRFVNILTQLDEDGNFFDFAPYEKDLRGNQQTLSRYSVIFESGNVYRVLTDTYTGAGFADFYTLNSSGVANSYNGEETFAAMVNWVMRDEHKTAYFTTGHSETYNISLYNVLVCAGYYVEDINLRKVDKIPDDAGLVVISNPVSDFERAVEGSNLRSEMELLEAYAERGGNFFVTLDPYVKETKILGEFLAKFGISVDRADNGDGVIVKDDSNGITNDGFTLVADYASSELARNMEQKTASLGGNVIVRDVASITLSGDAQPLLYSSETAVSQSGGKTVNEDGSYVIAAYSQLVGEEGNTASMCVIPSVYITATDAIVTNGYSNKDFLYALCELLYDGGAMPYGCNSIVYDQGILENLTMGTARIYTAAIIAIPAMIAMLGFAVLIRRKNR